jgi:hypothetical protein
LEETKPQARVIRSADADEDNSESSLRESNPKKAVCQEKIVCDSVGSTRWTDQ